jgi:2-isopropylmalate synthase
VELLGHHVDKEELNTLYQNFLVLADEKGNVDNDDLHMLIGNLPVLTK